MQKCWTSNIDNNKCRIIFSSIYQVGSTGCQPETRDLLRFIFYPLSRPDHCSNTNSLQRILLFNISQQLGSKNPVLKCFQIFFNLQNFFFKQMSFHQVVSLSKLIRFALANLKQPWNKKVLLNLTYNLGLYPFLLAMPQKTGPLLKALLADRSMNDVMQTGLSATATKKY